MCLAKILTLYGVDVAKRDENRQAIHLNRRPLSSINKERSDPESFVTHYLRARKRFKKRNSKPSKRNNSSSVKTNNSHS